MPVTGITRDSGPSMLDMTADDVEEVDLAGLDQPLADLEPFRARNALVPVLVRDQPAPTMKSGPTAARTASMTISEKRRRLSSEPS